MIGEVSEVKRYFGFRFGIFEKLKDGIYAIPTQTSKGAAFMKIELKNASPFGMDNYKLYWDEKLTRSWCDSPRPMFLKESKFATQYRKLIKIQND